MNIEIIVDGEGLADVETLQIPEGSAVREIVAWVAARGGFRTEDAFLFVEDTDEPLDLATIATKENLDGRVYYVHRIPKIEVTVFYQSNQLAKSFSPSVRIQRVLDWAVGRDGFKIDPVIAPEMELALHGQTTALPKNAHIGRYVRHPHREVAFDLIRGVVPNGAAW